MGPEATFKDPRTGEVDFRRALGYNTETFPIGGTTGSYSALSANQYDVNVEMWASIDRPGKETFMDRGEAVYAGRLQYADIRLISTIHDGHSW